MSPGALEAAGGLALILFNGIGVWIIRGWFTRMSNIMDRLERKMDSIMDRQSGCRENLPALYATREELRETLALANMKISELDRGADEHAERIAKLEARADKAA